MIDFDFKEHCYGCRNCENVCPVGAIEMVKDKDGFLYPKIDKDKCIKCGLCDRNCPYIEFASNDDIKKNRWVACYAKNKIERRDSTSGGIFYQIARKFIQKGGLVCGCIWNENLIPIHVIASNENELDKMRGSKYMQSDMSNVIQILKKNIVDKKILFSGTPCQIAAVKLALGNHKNLYTCSLICEGAGSSKVWEKYKNKLEQKRKVQMINASFRNKEIGWDSPIARYEFNNKKIRKTLSFEYDLYVMGFLKALYYRNSCSNCQYKGNGHNGDIIVGDLWGANLDLLSKSEHLGVSVAILSTEKGERLLDIISEDTYTFEVNKDEVIKYNKLLIEPVKVNPRKDEFYRHLDDMDIMDNIKKNITYNPIKRIVKELLYKIGLFKGIKKVINKKRR